MEGMLITGGHLIGAIVSPNRPLEYFERIGRLGLDVQRVNLGQGPAVGRVWVDTGSDMVLAQVVDELGVPA